VRETICRSNHCADKKKGPKGPKESSAMAYLRLSSPSGGNTMSMPSMGKALSWTENPIPSLCGKAAPILVHFFPVLPLLSYSSTVKTFKYVSVGSTRRRAKSEARQSEAMNKQPIHYLSRMDRVRFVPRKLLHEERDADDGRTFSFGRRKRGEEPNTL
jgi:hypothetical protein